MEALGIGGVIEVVCLMGIWWLGSFSLFKVLALYGLMVVDGLWVGYIMGFLEDKL